MSRIGGGSQPEVFPGQAKFISSPATASLATAWFAIAWLTSLCVIPTFPGESFATPADVSISPSVASLFVGKEKVVEGIVSAAPREGNVVRLQLGTPPQSLTVSLVIGLLSNFPPDPEHYYLGKTVRVVGTIQSFRGAGEIAIHDPALIQVVDASVPPAARLGAPAVNAGSQAGAPAAARAPLPAGDSSVQGRLDDLAERIRVLEDRVQQLERSGAHAGER